MGDPERYDPKRFPASSNIVNILSQSIGQIKNVLSSNPAESTEASADSSAPLVPPSVTALPKAIILGFSKGGTVVNQITAELARWKPVSAGTMMNGGKPFPQLFHEIRDHACPVSKDELPSSIAEIHYLDVGLNSAGAYLTDSTVIGKAVENLLANHIRARFMLHGTPKQWCDKNRSWIRKERPFAATAQ